MSAFSLLTDEKIVGYVLFPFFNRNHPAVYLIFNKMFYFVLTQPQYISLLATCFGFYKTIFSPMLTF
jgi:hypothetical protein